MGTILPDYMTDTLQDHMIRVKITRQKRDNGVHDHLDSSKLYANYLNKI